jgi:hypothetical protein
MAPVATTPSTERLPAESALKQTTDLKSETAAAAVFNPFYSPPDLNADNDGDYQYARYKVRYHRPAVIRLGS